jgi:hypothetical protein
MATVLQRPSDISDQHIPSMPVSTALCVVHLSFLLVQLPNRVPLFVQAQQHALEGSQRTQTSAPSTPLIQARGVTPAASQHSSVPPPQPVMSVPAFPQPRQHLIARPNATANQPTSMQDLRKESSKGIPTPSRSQSQNSSAIHVDVRSDESDDENCVAATPPLSKRFRSL